MKIVSEEDVERDDAEREKEGLKSHSENGQILKSQLLKWQNSKCLT